MSRTQLKPFYSLKPDFENRRSKDFLAGNVAVWLVILIQRVSCRLGDRHVLLVWYSSAPVALYMLQIPAKMLITVRMALALAHTWRYKFSRGPLHLDWKYQDKLSKAVVVLVVAIWKRWGNLIPHYLVLIKRLLPRTRMSRQRIRCLLRRARWSQCWWWRVLQQCQCRFTPSTSRWRY